jgi:hypothetical protein
MVSFDCDDEIVNNLALGTVLMIGLKAKVCPSEWQATITFGSVAGLKHLHFLHLVKDLCSTAWLKENVFWIGSGQLLHLL